MLGHFPGPASSTVHGWLYGSSSVDRAEAGTAKTPLVIRGDIAPETVCWHHEVGTWSKRNPNSHINNLWKRASNFFAHKKNQKKLYGKAFLIPPSMLAWVQSVSKLKFAGACGFPATGLAHSVFVWRQHLWPAAEVGFPLSSLSGYWEAPSLGPLVNCFLPACHLASHICWFNSHSAFSNMLKIQINSNCLKVIYP